jgi:hypothetical protein
MPDHSFHFRVTTKISQTNFGVRVRIFGVRVKTRAMGIFGVRVKTRAIEFWGQSQVPESKRFPVVPTLDPDPSF